MRRDKYLKAIETHFQIHAVCALLGPRQVGKTTLAKIYLEKFPQINIHFFDLENPLDLARLQNPMLTLSRIEKGLIVIDEIQRKPELFSILRLLVDEKKERKFLILGSASRDLIRQSSETLAGRIGYIELAPFSMDEVKDREKLWIRGGFPLAFLAENDQQSYLWRQSYISTFLERDIPNLGFQIPPEHIRRFWLMLAHYHGQLFNAQEIGKSLGISDHTVKRYLDILIGTFMIRRLSPWYENLSKRQIKSSKIYFRDSGILHALLGIQNISQLNIYPKIGSFWEGFVLEEIIRLSQASSEECFFWRTSNGAELDLLILKEGQKIGYEVKYTDKPHITPSMKSAEKDLSLDHLYIVYPGKHVFPLSDKITAKGFDTF